MISVIIPSYKGAALLRKSLPDFVRHLQQKKIDHEILVVDDGSNDNGETEKVVLENGCRFLKNHVNMGKGAAVRNGMLNAKGDIRIFTDVDIPFEYKNLENFIYYLDFKEFDIAIGDRTLPQSTYFSHIPKMRRLGSNIFTFIVGRFITTGIFDTQCGIKGFRKNIAEDLFSVSKINGFAFDVELMYISLKRNYDIKRLPVNLRNQGGSSINLLYHGAKMLTEIFTIKINNVRGLYKKRTA